MVYYENIVKALGFQPLPTAIIIALLAAIYFLIRREFDRVIRTRSQEIKVVKVSLDTLTDEIDKIKDNQVRNNNATTLLAYHQCMNEAMKWQEKGEIPIGAKMHFDIVWDAYKDLGDGHGDDPKKMIDSLKVV